MEGSYNFKNIDKSLDDIIQRNSLTRPNFKAKNRRVDFRPRKSLDQIVKRARQDRKSAEAFVCKSMFISGLAPTVEQADLEQLFTPYGATVKMHFREDGKFIGSAELIAPSFKSAKNIYLEFNKRLLDDYPMNIRFATEYGEVVGKSSDQNETFQYHHDSAFFRRSEKVPAGLKSAEELDKEMEDYMAQRK